MGKEHKNYVRVRCLMCGFPQYLSSFRKTYDMDVFVQHVKGGRAKKDAFRFYRVNDYARLEEMRAFFKARIKELMHQFGITAQLGRPDVDYPFQMELPLKRAGSELTLEVQYA